MNRGNGLNRSLSHPQEQRKLSAVMAGNSPETASDPCSCSQTIPAPATLERMGMEVAIGMGLDFFPIWYILLSEVGPATLERWHEQKSWTALGLATSCCVTLSWSVYLSKLLL